MTDNKNNNNILITLNSDFQKKLFQEVIEKYGNSIKASKMLGIPASSIRGYKNLYFKSISNVLLETIISLNIVPGKEISKNTIKTFNRSKLVQSCLDKGRIKIKNKFRKLKEEIPSPNKIIFNDFISVSSWLEKYRFLVDSPFRKIDIMYNKKNITINYKNFVRTEFKKFRVKIPKRILLNEDFIYFFGLWCGDRAGGKRLGICNQDKNLLDFSEKFLKKNFQTIEKILYIKKGRKKPQIKVDKEFIIEEGYSSWVVSIHSNNGIFSSFFYYLLDNLEEFLKIVKNREIFFAVLFDAEGNVSLYNKSLRWSCKKRNLVRIYSNSLREMGLFRGYDGCSLTCYNTKKFYEKIFPYIKNEKKRNLISLLCTGKGKLPKNHKKILKYLARNENKTAKEITKALKRTKVYSELMFLRDYGFITSKSYPYQYKINKKGLKTLGD